MSEEDSAEVLEGYVVDIACIRRYPASELAHCGREHTKQCALMGHCIESGYGLVQEDGCESVLDTHATRLVVDTLTRSSQQKGIRLRVTRYREGTEMKTHTVTEARSGGG